MTGYVLSLVSSVNIYYTQNTTGKHVWLTQCMTVNMSLVEEVSQTG